MLSFCFDKGSIEKIRQDGKRLLNKDEGFKLIDETKEVIRKYQFISKELRIHVDSEKLPEIFQIFENTLLELFAYFMTSTEHVSFHAEDRLKKLLEEHAFEDANALFSLLISPTDHDLIYHISC